MAQYDWLLFDLDNTILDFNKSSKVAFSNLLKRIDHQLDADKLYPNYNRINRDIWEKREAGKISHTELKWKRWSLFFEEARIDADPHQANDHYFENIKKFPFYVDFAQSMLGKISNSKNLMMVTNGLSEVQWPRIKEKNLQPHFKHIVISDEIGVAKPQKEFFDHCHQLMNSPIKEKVLVIGDTLKSDILGGNNFGYNTCWFDYYAEGNKTNIKPDFTISRIDQLLDLI